MVVYNMFTPEGVLGEKRRSGCQVQNLVLSN